MNVETLNRVFNKSYVQTILFLLLLFLLLPAYLTSNNYLCEIEDVSSCLDESWILSINWALQKHLVFGTDYVFTYGALGFLATRTDLGLNRFYFVIFDLFILANLAFILFYVFRRFYNLQTIPVAFLAVFTVSGSMMYAENLVFVLLLISIFWLNFSIKHSSIRGLAVPVVITTLLFFIKVNISFIGIIIFYGYLFYFLFNRRERFWGKILCGLAVPFLIFLLSVPLRTDIPDYVLGSLNLIDGYNDAMLSNARENLNYALLAAALLFIYAVVFFFKNFRKNIVLFLTYGIFSFVLFKQSFVRSDSHILAFFTLFPACASLLLVFYRKPTALQTRVVRDICLCCLTIGLQLGIYASPSNRLNYFRDVFSAPDSRPFENSFERFALPSNVRETIGQQSVDIIPWNINYLYFNRLNYNPRPVIQSYSVYTPYLLNLNKQKYEGDAAPEFVIFTNQTIDARYAAFDDQQAKLALIKNYACRGLFNSQGHNFLLFQKKPNNAAIEFSAPVEQTVRFEEDYNFKDTGKIYFVKADLDYSLFGKAVRFCYKPFQLIIAFTFADGSTYQHILVTPTLRNGVLINPYIKDEADFWNFVNGYQTTDNKKIKGFKIIVNLPTRFARKLAANTYKKEINLSISEVSIVRNN